MDNSDLDFSTLKLPPRNNSDLDFSTLKLPTSAPPPIAAKPVPAPATPPVATKPPDHVGWMDTVKNALLQKGLTADQIVGLERNDLTKPPRVGTPQMVGDQVPQGMEQKSETEKEQDRLNSTTELHTAFTSLNEIPDRIGGIFTQGAAALSGDTKFAEQARRYTGLTSNPSSPTEALAREALRQQGYHIKEKPDLFDLKTSAINRGLEHSHAERTKLGAMPTEESYRAQIAENKLRQSVEQPLDAAYAAMGAEPVQREPYHKPEKPAGFAEKTGRTVLNAADDLRDLVGGVIELGNEIVGVTRVPKGQTTGQHAGELGKSMAEMPGQLADLAEGLTDWGSTNSLRTRPITTITSLLPILEVLDAAKASPKLAARANALRAGLRTKLVDPFVDTAVGRVAAKIGDVSADALAAVKRQLADGLLQRDPRAMAIAEQVVNSPEQAAKAILNLIERAARQVEQGKVELIRPELERTTLAHTPAFDVAEANRAAQQYGNAAEHAEKTRMLAHEATNAEGLTHELGKDVRDVQHKADVRAQRIADAAVDEHWINEANAPTNLNRSARATGARAAQAGVEMAQAIEPLDAQLPADAAHAAAIRARRFLRPAETTEAHAAELTATAGQRPQVALGDVWTPVDRAHAGALETTTLPGDSLRERFPEAPDAAIADIERASADASKAKKIAMDNGFDPAAQVDPQWLDRMGLPDNMPAYETARQVAEHFAGRNVGGGVANGLQLHVQAALEVLGIEPKQAPAVAKWVLGEVEAQNQAHRLETPHGAIRVPAPEIKQVNVRGGMERSAADSAQFAQDVAAGRAQPLQDYQVKAAQELSQMKDKRLGTQEPPRPYLTNNEVFNQAVADAGEWMRKSGYFATDRTPGTVVDHHAAIAEQHLHALTGQRIAQRIAEALENDTTQLLRSKEVQKAMLREFAQRVKAKGLPDAQKIVTDFAKELRDTNKQSGISKNRFVEVNAPDGSPLWTRADYAQLEKLIPEKRLNKVRAEVIRSIGADMAESAQAYGTVHNVMAETQRFLKTPNGEPIPQGQGAHATYARTLIERVVDKGELPPQLLPYDPKAIAEQLRAQAPNAANPAAAIELADSLTKYKSAEHGALGKAMDRYWRTQFKGTEQPIENFAKEVMAGVHIKPSMASSLVPYFDALTATKEATGLWQAAIRLSKKNLVAANAKALTNNNLSNIVAQVIRRADLMQIPNMIKYGRGFAKFLDGKTEGMKPADVQMYDSLHRTNINTSNLTRDIGTSSYGAGDWLQRKMDWNSVAGGPVAKTAGFVKDAYLKANDALVESYTKLGDLPFRIEDAVHNYKNVQSKVAVLKPGQFIDVPISDAQKIRVTRIGDGVQLDKIGGPHSTSSGKVVSMDSPELSQVAADYGNWRQEKLFFDYNKIGNWGKTLRSGPFSFLSGIFSWYFKSMDIPFIKQGIMSEVLSGPPTFETNAPQIQAMQAHDARNLATRRAFVAQAGSAAFNQQRDQEELRRSVGFNQAVVGATVAPSDESKYLEVSNREPLNFGGATANTLGAIGAIANAFAFPDVSNDPALARAMLIPDVNATPAQLGRARQFGKMVQGHDYSPAQALQMLGLGGAPLLTTINRFFNTDRPVTVRDGIREFAREMFGSSAVDVGNVAAAWLGTHGVDSALNWSTYAHDQATSGFHGGTNEGTADAAGLIRWTIRQFTGLGASKVLFDADRNSATQSEKLGRMEAFLRYGIKKSLHSWVTTAESNAENVKSAMDAYVKRNDFKKNDDGEWVNPDPQLLLYDKQWNQAVQNIKLFKGVIKDELASTHKMLTDLYKQLH